VCDCNYLACVIATRSYVWLQKIWLCLCGLKATWLFGIWLQAWLVCDCKNYLKCVIAKTAGLFLWLQKRKKELNRCVIAIRSYVWLQNLTLSVWLKSYLVIWYMIASLGSVWLQKTAGSFVIGKPYFECDIANTDGYVFRLRKKQELDQCVITTILRAWLQQEVICGCKPLTVCVVEIASLGVVCDCKNYFVCVIATILRVWLLPEVIFGCKTWPCLCGWNLLGYLVYDCKPE
jgi:hypothetical protein